MLKGDQHNALCGNRILITRAREQALSFVRQIVEKGGKPICYPLLKIRRPVDLSLAEDVERALRVLDSFDCVIFTSVNGVNYFYQWLDTLGLGELLPTGMKVIAVGPETAKVLRKRGIAALHPPVDYQQEGLVELLIPMLDKGEKVLLPTAAVTRPILRTALEQHGLTVVQIPVYENVYNDEELTDSTPGSDHPELDPYTVTSSEMIRLLHTKQLHIIPFTSSSSVTHLLELLKRQHIYHPQELLQSCALFCIGSVTAQTVEGAGLNISGVAKKATIPYLVQAMVDWCTQNKGET